MISDTVNNNYRYNFESTAKDGRKPPKISDDDGSFFLVAPSTVERKNNDKMHYRPSTYYNKQQVGGENGAMNSADYSPTSATSFHFSLDGNEVTTDKMVATAPSSSPLTVPSSNQEIVSTQQYFSPVPVTSAPFIPTVTPNQENISTPPSFSSAPVMLSTQVTRRATPKQTKATADGHTREKRLRRNRESAKVSRQKRRLYLDELEERVERMCNEMDGGRCNHVLKSIETIKEKRNQALMYGRNMQFLTGSCALSRTSTDLRIAATFHTQQLHGLVLPPSEKFLLWLTLQNDVYFRSGRSSSERLSAARIGDRMLTNGINQVPPCHGMWPLACKEIGFSYEQEEKIRKFQHNLLKSQKDSWVHRHTALASQLCLDSTHDAIQAAHVHTGNKERSVLDGILKESQKQNFLSWSEKNRKKIFGFHSKRQEVEINELSKSTEDKEKLGQGLEQVAASSPPDLFETSPSHHVAANLYILNKKIMEVFETLTPVPPIAADALSRKKLSRRPCFESLGIALNQNGSSKQEETDKKKSLSREVSSSSLASLKRTADEMSSSDSDEDLKANASIPHQCLDPKAEQEAAAPTIQKAVGFVKALIPLPKPVVKAEISPSAMAMATVEYHQSQPPQPQAQHQQKYQQQLHAPDTLISAPVPQPQPYQVEEKTAAVVMSDANAPYYNNSCPNFPVASEDRYLSGQGTGDGSVDILFSLSEEDWAIGGDYGYNLDSI